jgi:hypothetical protein
VMLGDGLKALGKEEIVGTQDLAELVADAMVPAASNA